jgi:hypothetical protein
MWPAHNTPFNDMLIVDCYAFLSIATVVVVSRPELSSQVHFYTLAHFARHSDAITINIYKSAETSPSCTVYLARSSG